MSFNDLTKEQPLLCEGYAEVLRTMLRGYDLPDAAWSAIDAIQHSGTHLFAMTNDLIEIARLNGQPAELARSPVHLDRFLPTLLQDSRTPRIYQRLVLHIQPDLPAVDADPDKLSRIVTNLIDNAVNYSPKDSPIVIETGAAAGFVRISVRDYGEGFPPEKVGTIFDRFNRGERRGGDGFGLGLYIVKLLTEAHGGHVFVCTEPKEGTTFSVYLPART